MLKKTMVFEWEWR